MKKVLSLLCFGLLAGVALYAADPEKKHPNLTGAQSLILQAQEKVTAAQKVNEFDLGGHAAKAKDFLDQANEELKLALAAADDDKEKKAVKDEKEAEKKIEELTKTIDAKYRNLAEAQGFIIEAHKKISDAQKANEFDLGGHAKKAKGLLEQANEELKLAAEAK